MNSITDPPTEQNGTAYIPGRQYQADKVPSNQRVPVPNNVGISCIRYRPARAGMDTIM